MPTFKQNPHRFSYVRVLGAGLALIPTAVFASSFQNFAGTAYSNPADLSFLVKNNQFIIGDYFVMPKLKFQGTVTVPDPSPVIFPLHRDVQTTGTSISNNTFDITYGRAAQRLNDEIVAGIDVSQPYEEVISYTNTSPARYSATLSVVHSVDIAPEIALQIGGPLSNLSLGLGLDELYFSTTLNQMYPSLPKVSPPTRFGSGADLSSTNYDADWTTGWHVGATYHLFRGTFVGLSYYSALNPRVTGPSTFTNVANTTSQSTVNLPATSNFRITQFFSERFLVGLGLHYTQWSCLKTLTLYNVASPSGSIQTVPVNYRNTWRVDMNTHYDFTRKWGAGAYAAYDQTPTNDVNRSIRAFGGDTTTLGGAIDYKVLKSTSVSLEYAHIFAVSESVNQYLPSGTSAVGTLSGNANVVGLKVTVNT